MYWETDQKTAGFGTANGQIWQAITANLWSTSSAGTGFAKGNYITSTIDNTNFGSDKAALGGGTVNVSGSVDAGTIRFWSSAGNILLDGGTFNLADTTTITTDNGSDTISSTITGAATSLTKAGTGSLVLTAANNYSGATNVNAGALVLSGGSANLNASSTVTVASGGHLQLSPIGDNGTFNYNSFSLNLIGEGADNNASHQTVSFQPANNNTYNLGSNVTVSSGVQFYTYGINNIVNLGGVFSGTGDMSFVGDGLDHHDFRFTGNSANSGYAGNYKIYSQNTWTYATLAGGTNTLPITAQVDLESQQGNTAAILDLNGNSQELAGLTSGGDHTNNNWVQNNGAGTPTLTINNAADNEFSGILGNGGNTFALTKTGAGTLTLTGANTYTGATAISGGKLIVNGNQLSATGAITVVAGTLTGAAVATLAGNGSIGGNVSLAAESTSGFKNGGVLAPIASASGTVLGVSGATAFGAGSIFEWNLVTADGSDPGENATNQGSYGQLAGTGAITGSDAVFKVVLTGNTFASNFWDTNKSWNNVFGGTGATTNLDTLFTSFDTSSGLSSTGIATGRGQFTFNGSTSTLTWSAVPEPSTRLVGLLVGAGLLCRRRIA